MAQIVEVQVPEGRVSLRRSHACFSASMAKGNTGPTAGDGRSISSTATAPSSSGTVRGTPVLLSAIYTVRSRWFTCSQRSESISPRRMAVRMANATTGAAREGWCAVGHPGAGHTLRPAAGCLVGSDVDGEHTIEVGVGIKYYRSG